MKDRKASGYYISLLILCFCTLLVTGFLLLHQLDLLLSIVSNTIAICTFIVGLLLLYKGIKEFRQARNQEEIVQNNNIDHARSIVRLPSRPTLFEYSAGGTSYTAPDRGFEELRKARGGRKKIPLNRNIIEGIILLAPVVSALVHSIDRSGNTLPPGYWYTLPALIAAYIYLDITFVVVIIIAIALIRSRWKKRQERLRDRLAGVPHEVIRHQEIRNETRE